MGNGTFGSLCYYKSYCEKGEILSCDLLNSYNSKNEISLYNNFNNNIRYENNNDIFNFSFENFERNYNINYSYIRGNSFNINNDNNNSNDISDSNNSNDISDSNDDYNSQLNSRILENVDKLLPEKKRCTICLENFAKFDKVINLNCLHMFHNNCIKKWLKKKSFCPICKNEVL